MGKEARTEAKEEANEADKADKADSLANTRLKQKYHHQPKRHSIQNPPSRVK